MHLYLGAEGHINHVSPPLLEHLIAARSESGHKGIAASSRGKDRSQWRKKMIDSSYYAVIDEGWGEKKTLDPPAHPASRLEVSALVCIQYRAEDRRLKISTHVKICMHVHVHTN